MLKADFEMIGMDINGTKIPVSIYDTPDEAEAELKDLYKWLNSEAYAV